MLVSTASLASQLGDPDWVVFDCRHDLKDFGRGAVAYAEGHVTGAAFAAVETDLSGPKTGRNGRHPLPDPIRFASFLAARGVTESTRIVAYDDMGGQYAARLWWMCRWIGLRGAAVLDGGWPKWIAEKRPVTNEVPALRHGHVSARPDAGMLVRTDEVVRQLGGSGLVVVDARAPERYRGETEPIDPVAGHIPGARNRFFKSNLRDDQTFRPPVELHQEFDALLGGIPTERVAHQCGSGVTACVNLLAMELAGLPGSKLYAGSWSEWIADPARPVARGA